MSSCSPARAALRSGGMIVGGVDVKAFAFEEALQQVNQAVIVIDDEQAIHRISFCLFRASLR